LTTIINSSLLRTIYLVSTRIKAELVGSVVPFLIRFIRL